MIIIEGMDNTGKSTLCNHLGKKFDLKVDIRSRPKNIDEGFRMISRSVFNETPTIYDRHVLISEIVYGPLLRNKSVFGNSNWDLLFLLLKTHPLIIYCRPPKRKVFRFGVREQMDGVVSQATNLIRRYDWLMEIIKPSVAMGLRPLHTFDYSKEGSTEEVEIVIRRYLKHRHDFKFDDAIRRIEVKDDCNLEGEK